MLLHVHLDQKALQHAEALPSPHDDPSTAKLILWNPAFKSEHTLAELGEARMEARPTSR